MYEAAGSDSLDALKVLEAAGANLSDIDRKGRTALHNAAKRGRIAAIEFFRERGFSYDITDFQGANSVTRGCKGWKRRGYWCSCEGWGCR